MTQGAGNRENVIRRRRVPRREFQRRVGLLVRGTYRVCPALQIGEGGMMIHSDLPLSVGAQLVISFKLPHCPPDVVRAVVRYVIPNQLGVRERYGVEFQNLDFNTKRSIRSYVATQASAGDFDGPRAGRH